MRTMCNAVGTHNTDPQKANKQTFAFKWIHLFYAR